MNSPLRVLFTCVGGIMVPAVLQHLRSSSRIPLTLFGSDSKEAPGSKHLLDGFFSVPQGHDNSYVTAVLDIVRHQDIDIVVPWSDKEAVMLSRNRVLFADVNCDIMASRLEVLDTICDKAATYRKLEHAGLSVPEYSIVEPRDDLIAAITDAGYPKRSVVVKPARGRGGRGLHVFLGKNVPPEWLGSGQREKRHESTDVLNENLSKIQSGTMLVMPCLKLPAYDVDVLANKGSVGAVVIRQRVNPTGIPWGGNTICRNTPFEKYIRCISEVLNLDSLHDVDLMSSEDGLPALLEVNPRMSGSLAATLAAGIPILDAALAGRMGIHLPVPIPDADIEINESNKGIKV